MTSVRGFQACEQIVRDGDGGDDDDDDDDVLHCLSRYVCEGVAAQCWGETGQSQDENPTRHVQSQFQRGIRLRFDIRRQFGIDLRGAVRSGRGGQRQISRSCKDGWYRDSGGIVASLGEDDESTWTSRCAVAFSTQN